MRIMIDRSAVTHATGDVRAAGTGDRVMVKREAWQRPDWALYWDAIGVAVARGADLRVFD